MTSLNEWKRFSTKSDAIQQKDECFHELVEQCRHVAPGAKLSYSLRNRLEKFTRAERKEIVNRVKMGCTPLFFACKRGQLEIVEYLVRVCGANLEQTGMYEVVDDRSVHSVTPLWCAAVSGKLPVTKFLVQKGANINAESDTGSTPVRSACFMTHMEIVQYLVEKGADINKPNYNGGTCLINSVQSVDLCRFLLNNGADVNAKDIQNKTALHYAIQEHRLETTKLLIEHGADVFALSKYGDDALQTACLKGAKNIFEFLVSITTYPLSRLADAHELIGSTFFDEHNDMPTTIVHWRIAQSIRETTPDLLPKKPLIKPHAAFRYQREYSSMTELDNILTDIDAVRIQSLLINERILGPYHKDTVFRLMFRGAAYADMMMYQRCIDLWRRALQIRVEKDGILYADTCFTAQALVRFMVDYNEKCVPPENDVGTHAQRFEDAMCTFKILTRDIAEARELLLIRPQFKRQIENFDKMLKCITHLIYLMLQSAKTDEQKQLMYEMTKHIIKLNPRSVTSDDTLLHLCISKMNTIRSGYFMDEDPITINPKYQVVQFLLQCGANVEAKNFSKLTPLHVAVAPYHVNNWLIPLLLDYGAHIDSPSALGERASDKVNKHPHNLNLNLFNYMGLKCLCATVVARFRIPYLGKVPKTLEQFIEKHIP